MAGSIHTKTPGRRRLYERPLRNTTSKSNMPRLRLACRHPGECQQDVPALRGVNIQDAKTDQGFQILTPGQCEEMQRLRRSSGYGHN